MLRFLQTTLRPGLYHGFGKNVFKHAKLLDLIAAA